MTLTLNTAIQYFQWTLWFMIYHQTKFGCKRIISSEDRVKTITFGLKKPRSVILTLKITSQVFAPHRGPMMMHHHIYFCYKRLSGSEDNIPKEVQSDGHNDPPPPHPHATTVTFTGVWLATYGINNPCICAIVRKWLSSSKIKQKLKEDLYLFLCTQSNISWSKTKMEDLV